MKYIIQTLFRFIITYIWQFPQALLAGIYYLMYRKNIVERIKKNSYTVYIGVTRGGVTLGNRVFISRYYFGERKDLVIAHEGGHVKQSKYLGPLYLFVIGIPSILWAATYKKIAPKKNYYSFPTERWANKLAGITVNKWGVLTWK